MKQANLWAKIEREILAIYAAPMRAKATLAKHRQCLEIWQRHCNNPRKIDVVTVSQIISDRSRDLAATSVNSLLRTMRTQCKFFVAQGYLSRSPFDARSFFIREKSSAKPRHQTIGELQKLFDTADAEVKSSDSISKRWKARRRRALLYLLTHTGLRKMEALTLRVEDVNVLDRIVWIEDKEEAAAGIAWQTKTEASRQPVPMTTKCALVLAEWIQHVPGKFLFPQITADRPWILGKTGYRPLDEIKALGERAGVDGVTLHSLRHSYATHAESLWGFTDVQIARILRHTNVHTQKKYRHADLENLRRLTEGKDFVIPPAPPAKEQPPAPPPPHNKPPAPPFDGPSAQAA